MKVKAFIHNAFSLNQGVSCDKNRVVLLDFIRGFAMILVVLGHSGVPGDYYLMLFHMPLFFILSGYTKFLRSEKTEAPFGTYFKKLFFSLMLPNYCFEIINSIIWCGQQWMRGKPLPTAMDWFHILTLPQHGEFGAMGHKFWFLPCMFVSSIFFYWILRLCKSKMGKVSVTVFLVLLADAVSRVSFSLPLQLDTAVLGTLFLMIGYLGGEFIRDALQTINPLADFIMILLMVFCVWFAKYNNAYLDMQTHYVQEYPYMLIAALSGSFACILIAKFLFIAAQNIYKYIFSIPFQFIRWCGANSLGVYLVHVEARSVTSVGIPMLSTDHWVILFMFLLLVTFPIVNTITAYFPFLFGKIRKR